MAHFINLACWGKSSRTLNEWIQKNVVVMVESGSWFKVVTTVNTPAQSVHVWNHIAALKRCVFDVTFALLSHKRVWILFNRLKWMGASEAPCHMIFSTCQLFVVFDKSHYLSRWCVMAEEKVVRHCPRLDLCAPNTTVLNLAVNLSFMSFKTGSFLKGKIVLMFMLQVSS